MDSRSTHSLMAARRVREIALDDAKRTLSDATYAREAARRSLASLSAQLAAALLHERTLSEAAALDVAALGSAQRFRQWLRGKLVAAQQSVSAAEREEVTARAALLASLGARDAVLKLQERRRTDAADQQSRHWQHTLDDMGSVRAMASLESFLVQSGDRHGR
jgi:flagellar biosynthesis chaperone FliJ